MSLNILVFIIYLKLYNSLIITLLVLAARELKSSKISFSLSFL